MEPKTELQKNAIANSIKKERETYQRAIDIQWFNDRIENGKMSRCLALIKKETEMEKDFKEKKDHATLVNSRAEKEISLAYEISAQAKEEACQLLRRHKLRETDPQLRELTQKLKGAYVRKDLEQQILHNQYKRLQDKIDTANANKIVQDAIYSGKVNERNKELEKRVQYNTELRKQIDNDHKIKLNTQKTEMAMQRKQMDEIVQSIEEDHKRNLEKKHQSVARVRLEMLESEESRRALRRREAETQEAELRRVAQEQAAATDRTTAALQDRLVRQKAREEMNKRIGDQIAAAEAQRDEREQLIRRLQQQEYLERDIQQDIAGKVRRAARGAQVRAALDVQTAVRVQAAQECERDDRARRTYMEANIAAEEEKERENTRLKRERARQYALELRRQMEEDERRRREDRDMEERRAAAVREHQLRWDSEARAEGEIILKEHGRVLTKD